MSAARPSEGAKAPLGGSGPRAAGEQRGDDLNAAVSMLPGADVPTASAVDLHARASANFEAKLHETVVTLLKAAATGPVTQASSLGAEDMVITHLINQHALPVPVFVLDTGALHAETLAFTHPITGEALSYVAEPPPSFVAALAGVLTAT